MDEVERKRLLEVADLLSSVNVKIFEMLKTKSRETFMTEHVSGVNTEIRGEKARSLKIGLQNVVKASLNESGRDVGSNPTENSKPPNPKGEKSFDNWALPKTKKFQWYRTSNEEGKIRRCENANCNLFLKYNNDKNTYEHWKFDANTGKAFFVSEGCGGEYP